MSGSSLSSSWGSYPSIYSIGHRAVKDLFNFPHVIEEKVDGSQFSFGRVLVEPGDNIYAPDSEGYALKVRSKGAVMVADAPEKMFSKGVQAVKDRLHLLQPGWTYRGEYLSKPGHNTLKYDRVPKDHVIIFDVSTGDGEWLPPDEMKIEAERIGFESVPVLHQDLVGGGTTLEMMRNLLDNTTSVLGGQLIEGVVVKPLVPLYGLDKKTLMSKFVSERFKEAHGKAWSEANPSGLDIVSKIQATLTHPGRWMKAVQHLRDRGELTDSPKDIGPLIKEVQADILKEDTEWIKDALFAWAKSHIVRKVTVGLPEWYKESVLLPKQFESSNDGEVDVQTNSEPTDDRPSPAVDLRSEGSSSS